MAFHSSFTGSGLTNPTAFQNWISGLVEEWDFEHLCTAHNGRLVGGGKQGSARSRVRLLISDSEDDFKRLAVRQSDISHNRRVLSAEERSLGAWSPSAGPLDEVGSSDTSCECG